MEALSQPILMTVLVLVDLGAARPSQSSHPVTLPGDKYPKVSQSSQRSHPVTLPGDKYPWTESSKLDKQLEQTSPSTWIESEGEENEKWVWGVVREEESGSRFEELQEVVKVDKEEESGSCFEELQEGSGDGKTVFEIILEDIFETS